MGNELEVHKAKSREKYGWRFRGLGNQLNK